MWLHAVMRPGRRLALLAAAALLVSGLAACGGGGGGDTTLTVYAASSLTAAFEKIGKAFEEQHEGVHVQLSFGGSSDLVAQIQQGAPVDVFASADTANMDKLVADGLP